MDNTNRCEWVTGRGQCPDPRIEDSRFCEKHSPSGHGELDKYLITTRSLGDSPHRHAASKEIKSLRDEIALIRALIEKRINLIQSDAEFIAAMPTIQSAMMTVEKLVSSCHTMETKLGLLLNKGSLLSLAQTIIHIISEALEGVPNRNEIVEQVGQEIVKAIAAQDNKEN